jgi:hypothetical protein
MVANLAFADGDVGMLREIRRPPATRPVRGVEDLSHPVASHLRHPPLTGDRDPLG